MNQKSSKYSYAIILFTGDIILHVKCKCYAGCDKLFVSRKSRSAKRR